MFFPINSLSSELYRLHQRGPAAGPAAGSQPGGDVVRRPLTSVSFSVLISNALSSFFLFCARRLFHRGSSLGGIGSDPFRAGGGITPWGDAVRRPQIVFAAGRRRAVGSPTFRGRRNGDPNRTSACPRGDTCAIDVQATGGWLSEEPRAVSKSRIRNQI